MAEYADLIGNYGMMVIIAALFVYDWVVNRKSTNDAIIEMAKTNANTAKSLELLQKSMENQEHIMQEHDKRSIEALSILHDIHKVN